jgi:hypothetical protein
MVDPSKARALGFASRCNRCFECKKSFLPSPRLKSRQKTCRERACQLAYRARYRRQYRRKNFEAEEDSRKKTKASRSSNFWKEYRKSHASSSERNRLNTKLRKRLRNAGLQRQLDIVQVVDPTGYFDLFQGFATSHRSLLEECHATSAA